MWALQAYLEYHCSTRHPQSTAVWTWTEKISSAFMLPCALQITVLLNQYKKIQMSPVWWEIFFSFYSQNNKIVCQACINLGQFKQLFDSKIVKSIGITSLSQPFFDVAIFWEQFCKTHFCCLIWLTTVDSISSKYTSWVFDVLEQEAKDFTFCFYSFI